MNVSNIFFYGFIILLIIVFIILIYTKGVIPRLRIFIQKLKKYAYLILMFPTIVYLVFFGIYLLNPKFKESIDISEELINFLGQVAIVFFGSGIFSAALKFLDSMNVFNDNFKKIILSDEFDEVLSSKIDALAYSKEHLIKQNNIEDIWQNVTLCKYEREFPNEVYDKLKKKIKNDLFNKNNISYYFKNFQINYTIRLIDNKYIEIMERSSFTIKRPSIDPFEFDFYSKNVSGQDENTSFECKFKTKNSEEIVFDNITDEDLKYENEVIKKYVKKLSGHKEYHIESYTKSVNELDLDRFFTFGCSRIIDDLTINIEHSDDICVIFKQNTIDKLYHNGAFDEKKLAFINRDVLLPGEKYTMFFYRAEKQNTEQNTETKS